MRTFVAIELPKEFTSRIDQLQNNLRKTKADVSWVKPQNVHITLKFLGEVKEEKIEEVYRATEQSVNGIRKFQVNLQGLGGFPNLKRPRVIWIGVEKGKEILAELYPKVEEQFFKIGFAKENRDFTPHLTIGRVKFPKSLESLATEINKTSFETQEFEVQEVVVMKSTLHPAGSIYTPLKKVLLS